MHHVLMDGMCQDGDGCTRGHPLLEETWGCAGTMLELHLALELTVCALGTSI